MRYARILVIILTCISFLLWHHEVSTSLTPDDRIVISAFLKKHHLSAIDTKRSYQQEVAFIRAAQVALLEDVPIGKMIPFDQSREPRDLFAAREGLCDSRSRTLEKILNYSGFDVRHAFILARHGDESLLQTLTASSRPSHAVLEVRTAHGWLAVDTNSPWLAVRNDGEPVSLKSMAKQFVPGAISIQWTEPPTDPIFKQDFVTVFGLYSRHGRFYPPYNAIPDVNYRELLENLAPH